MADLISACWVAETSPSATIERRKGEIEAAQSAWRAALLARVSNERTISGSTMQRAHCAVHAARSFHAAIPFACKAPTNAFLQSSDTYR